MADQVAAISTTVEKTNRILSEIEREMGWQGRPDQALSALRVVMHTLRDRLPVNEAAGLGAQLPELVRGIYYEGWSPGRVPVKMNREEFLDEVRRRFVYARGNGIDIEQMIRVVLETISLHVDHAEMQKVKASLPKNLATLIPD
ncbi:MAG: DUF2267 domain-containing protein [Thermoleophilia bacterium]|nr:DUF2267 domain-containing protein [Thermoleophilia bacterium]